MLSFITENLLKKALTFANGQALLINNDKAIIHDKKKSLPLTDQQAWINRSIGLFDFSMGAYNVLARNYLLHKLSKPNDEKDIGLHRDQQVAVVKK